MFNTTCSVLDNIIDEGKTPTQRGQAFAAFKALNSIEFVLILHFMQESMEITDNLSQALQRKSQDILNALHLVRTTKVLIHKLRNDGWNDLLSKVCSFCNDHDIEVLYLCAKYKGRRGRGCHQSSDFTMESHYRINIFYDVIDFQLQETNTRFNEQPMTLLSLSCALDTKSKCDAFDHDQILELANKYYPGDFTEEERTLYLRMELRHYGVEISMSKEIRALSSVTDLYRWMVESGRSITYPLIFRLVSLVLTLPVSTTTTECAFSVMKIVKNRLRTRTSDDYLTNTLMIYIKKELVDEFDVASIIDTFHDSKERIAAS